ncbi:MoaD/ThiS family protein [Coralliovum pocilloporae]|uniref:MoaD/ThiS family protein n=1 Tax=Coralliovum pocilloporae TaxID=3066369 RepID=UPI00330782ED
MVKVVLWGALTHATNGEAELDLDVRTVKELLTRLETDYPALAPQLKKGVSVAIDGQIYRDAWFAPIPEGAEVFVLPRMVGG